MPKELEAETEIVVIGKWIMLYEVLKHW